MPRVKDIVSGLAEPVVLSLGLELVDVEYVKEGKDWVLRVYIYKKAGVSIDDCVAVTHRLNAILDEKDPAPGPYTLEVSSPGLDKPFKSDRDFVRYQGEWVEVQLFKPRDGVKFFEGKLVGLLDGGVKIEEESGEIADFPKAEVATVKRPIRF